MNPESGPGPSARDATSGSVFFRALAALPDFALAALALRTWIAGISMGLYVACVFVVMFIPMPHLGITPSVVAGVGNGVGFWPAEPWRALALATMYFGACGLLGLTGLPTSMVASARVALRDALRPASEEAVSMRPDA